MKMKTLLLTTALFILKSCNIEKDIITTQEKPNNDKTPHYGHYQPHVEGADNDVQIISEVYNSKGKEVKKYERLKDSLESIITIYQQKQKIIDVIQALKSGEKDYKKLAEQLNDVNFKPFDIRKDRYIRTMQSYNGFLNSAEKTLNSTEQFYKDMWQLRTETALQARKIFDLLANISKPSSPNAEGDKAKLNSIINNSDPYAGDKAEEKIKNALKEWKIYSQNLSLVEEQKDYLELAKLEKTVIALFYKGKGTLENPEATHEDSADVMTLYSYVLNGMGPKIQEYDTRNPVENPESLLLHGGANDLWKEIEQTVEKLGNKGFVSGEHTRERW